MTPIQIWRMIWARRFVIAVTVAICLVLGGLVGKMVPKEYEARTRVMLDTLSPDPVTGQAMSGASVKAYVQAQTEIIRDFRIAGAVVDHFGWTKKPEFIAAYRAQEGRVDENGIRRWLAQMVIDGTWVAQTSPTSNIVEIGYRSTSPDSARKIVDAVRDAYMEQTLAFKRESAANNSRWFRQQANKLKTQLAAAEARKSDFEKKNGIILQDDNVDAESAKLRAMTAAASVPPPVMPGVAVAPSALSGQVAQIESQIAVAQQQLGPNHPEIVALRRQRDAVAAAASREQAAARAASRQVSSGPSITSMINSQTRKVLDQRGLVGEAQRLAGEVSVLRDQLAKTTAKAADFELQSQSTDVGLAPLGNAVAPDAPISPYFFLFLLGGIVVGLFLGLAIALALEFVFRRIRGVEDLEVFEGLPVLGVLPPRGRKEREFRFPFGFGRTQGAAAS
ncbi:MAG TPA: Wzz/FepE/Etk N-terminal domain-containing protein [Novosphingobium sp.]